MSPLATNALHRSVHKTALANASKLTQHQEMLLYMWLRGHCCLSSAYLSALEAQPFVRDLPPVTTTLLPLTDLRSNLV